MIIDIGIVAGEIWHYLDDNGDTKLLVLVDKLERPKELVLMSLGWLAREGHVTLKGKADYEVSLREKSKS